MSHLLPMTCAPLTSHCCTFSAELQRSVWCKLVFSTLPQVKQRTGIIIRPGSPPRAVA